MAMLQRNKYFHIYNSATKTVMYKVTPRKFCLLYSGTAIPWLGTCTANKSSHAQNNSNCITVKTGINNLVQLWYKNVFQQ